MSYNINTFAKRRLSAGVTAIFTIAVMGLFTATTYADPVLRGYWTFDSDTVDSGLITESSGYQAAGTHDGQLVGSGISFNPIAGETGSRLTSGNYISFTNDSYAVILNTSTNMAAVSPNYQNTYDPAGAQFSISMWVKGLPDGNWDAYLAKYGENNYGYQIRRHETGTSPTFTYRISGGDDDPAPNIAGAYTNLNDNSWHHLVGVYGGTYRELYMDGQLITRIVDTATSAGGQGEPLVFGGRYNASAGAYQGFANASLDDVAFYAGALRNNQITYLNNGGDPTQMPAAEANTIKFSMTHSGKGDNNTTMTFSGKTAHSWLDGEAIFYGKPGYLKTDLPVGSAGLNGSFTASAWIYMNDVTGDQPILGNSTEGTNQGLHLMVRDGKPLMGFYNNDLQANQTLEAEQWYYLTFQYNADTKQQSIYLNGEQIATRTATSNFTGGKTLDIGRIFDGNATYFRGKMNDIAITDGVLSASEIQSIMNSRRDMTRVEDFSSGKNTDEWYTGGGATLGVAYLGYTGKNCLHTYYGIQDGTASTVYGQTNSDASTTTVWGPQFTVANDIPDDAAITFSVAGTSTALNFNSRTTGGAGVALWDLTTGDFVRDGSGNVISKTGNNTGNWHAGSFSLKGLEGHDLMVVALDRQTNGYGWIALTDLTADSYQVRNIASAVQHHLVLNDFNFDKAGDFNGMYEIDSEGNKLDSITHFTNGSRNGSAATNFYVDESGLSSGTKGFLSSGTAAYGEEQTTGTLRSAPFLVQGDIMEFLIAGGNNIANKHFDLIDADTGEVYFSATGENSNDFRYDFWNLKDIQGKSVYIQVVDSDGGTSWSHLELDQIRQTKFAPTAAEVEASENVISSKDLAFNENLPGLNMQSYALDGTGIDSLDALANYISHGAEPTKDYYRHNLGGFSAGEGMGVDAFSTLNVESSGQYTLAVSNDEAYRLILNGETIFESNGSAELEFISLTLSEVGQYAFEMLYLDQSGKGVSLYLAEGAFSEWNNAFSLLNGFGGGYLNSYADFFVGGNEVPEPTTWALLILGVAGMVYWRKRK